MIKITNLQKNYKDFSLSISLAVPAGTVTGLIGKNGCGKSTTIKAILGLIKPDGGTIEVLGADPRHFSSKDKENLGVALSDSGFSMMLSIKEIVKILRKTYPEFNAKLLVLDEPTSGLDVLARNELLDMLRNYLDQDNERSILISSHISSDLEGLCDDIYMIHKGQILLHEDTDTILGQYGILKISEDEFAKIDQQYLIAKRKESFGYSCLTNEKQFYLDNYPNIVVENGNLDDMIMIMLGGK